MTRYILVLNAGSSSLKFAAFAQDSAAEIARGQVSGIGTTPKLQAGKTTKPLPDGTDFGQALHLLFDWLAGQGLRAEGLCGTAHRMVHGGTRFVAPVVVDGETLAALEGLKALAPLHMPPGLGVLRDTLTTRPDVPHVACFDTAFHATQPERATRIPIPRALRDKGYRRYGFHGLNYEHVVRSFGETTGKPLPRRLIVAHLGSGASMCAILDGCSVATTMGFSTADGLVMGTRPGSIDAGVLISLMRDEKMTADEIEEMMYRRSGLLALSGTTPDMKALLDLGTPEAMSAVDQYCYAAACHASALVTALGGIDALAFTGGVGENSAAVRERICSNLAWLRLGSDNIHVIPANEELAMARHAAALFKG